MCVSEPTHLTPIHGGLSWVTKFLTHHKMSQIGFIHLQPSLW